MREWHRLGLLFAPDPELPWQRSHAALPTVLDLGDGRHRVFYASRDAEQRSHVGWFDADLARGEVLDRCRAPALAPGPAGWFDDRGVYAASAVRDGDAVLLFTIGWNVGPPPLYYPSIGRAVSDDGGRTFTHSRAPLLARSEHDPWMVSAPYVLREGGRWRMWYLSGTGWDEDGDRLRSAYDVKYAESADGLAWRRDGHVCFGGHRNVSRACVLPAGDGYLAWFAADDGAGYRIHHATSPDGLHWTRAVEAGPLAPAGGDAWDGEAVAYPFVLRAGGRLVMLYNGDGFGRDGIGLAVAA